MDKNKKNIVDLGNDDNIAENNYLLDNNIQTDFGFLKEKKEIIYNLPWIEKYRPEKFSDIISHNDILNALENLIKNKSLPHLIFYGPPGTGKTTTILACAKKLYGKFYKNMILELNGSDDRGINVVREQIKDFSVSKQFIGSFSKSESDSLKNNIKLVILDEADSMTYDAQFALRRVIENYTYNTRFCLICNYETKIIDALKSRCVIFKFSPIPHLIHKDKLKHISKIENIDILDDALDILIKLAEGDMRKSINLIQSINTALKINNKAITVNDVLKQIGHPSIEDKNNIIDVIFNKKIDLMNSINQIEHFKLKFGLTTADIIRDLSLNIVNNIDKIHPIKSCKILDKLGDIEIYLSISYNDTILLSNVVSTIKNIINFD